jgi:hypothetical protein
MMEAIGGAFRKQLGIGLILEHDFRLRRQNGLATDEASLPRAAMRVKLNRAAFRQQAITPAPVHAGTQFLEVTHQFLRKGLLG